MKVRSVAGSFLALGLCVVILYSLLILLTPGPALGQDIPLPSSANCNLIEDPLNESTLEIGKEVEDITVVNPSSEDTVQRGWCYVFSIDAKAGDLLSARISNITSSNSENALILQLRVFLIKDRNNLNDLDFKQAVSNIGNPTQIEINLGTLVDSGTYLFVLHREGANLGEQGSSEGSAKAVISYTQSTGMPLLNMIELDGLLPSIIPMGALCSQTDATISYGAVDASKLPPETQDMLGSYSSSLREAGHRWTFYGDANTPFTVLISLKNTPETLSVNVLENSVSLWRNGSFLKYLSLDSANHTVTLTQTDSVFQTGGQYTLVIHNILNTNVPLSESTPLDYRFDCVQPPPLPAELDIDGLVSHANNQVVTLAGLNVTLPNNINDDIFTIMGNDDTNTISRVYGNAIDQVEQILFLEDHIVLKIANDTQDKYYVTNLPANRVVDLEISRQGQGPLVIRKGDDVFQSDWQSPIIVWHLDKNYYATIDADIQSISASDEKLCPLPGVSAASTTNPVEPASKLWFSSTYPNIRITKNNGQVSLSVLLSENDVPTVQTDWQLVEQIRLTGSDKGVLADIKYNQQAEENQSNIGDFIKSSIIDLKSQSASLNNSSLLNVSSRGQQPLLELNQDGERSSFVLGMPSSRGEPRAAVFKISEEEISIFYTDESLANDEGAFSERFRVNEQQILKFEPERYFNAEKDCYVKTPYFILEREDGTRRLRLTTDNAITSPPASQIRFDPNLDSGQRSLNVATNAFELGLPYGLNNRGYDFCSANGCGVPAVFPGGVNPANGNLNYTIEDFRVPGYGLDLTLTRSFNSLYPTTPAKDRLGSGSNVVYGAELITPSSFGPGWTTEVDVYLDLTGSLLGELNEDFIAQETRDKRRPPGFVMLTTASGSQHYFYRDGEDIAFSSPVPNDTSRISCQQFAIPYRSDTMQGWVIYQCVDVWLLTRPDGLNYYFDRGGNLLRLYHRSGYELNIYWQPGGDVTGFYPAAWSENADAEELNILVRRIMALPSQSNQSDDQSATQIILYYGTYNNDREAQAISTPLEDLRVLMADAPGGSRIYYKYDAAGRLTHVLYPDGSEARYRYPDNLDYFIHHEDPRASDLPDLTYDMVSPGRVNQILMGGETSLSEEIPLEELALYSFTYGDITPADCESDNAPRTTRVVDYLQMDDQTAIPTRIGRTAEYIFVACGVDYQHFRLSTHIFNQAYDVQNNQSRSTSETFRVTYTYETLTFAQEFERFFLSRSGEQFGDVSLFNLRSVSQTAVNPIATDGTLVLTPDFDASGQMTAITIGADNETRPSFSYTPAVAEEHGLTSLYEVIFGDNTRATHEYVYNASRQVIQRSVDPLGAVTHFCYMPVELKVVRQFNSLGFFSLPPNNAQFANPSRYETVVVPRLAWRIGPFDPQVAEPAFNENPCLYLTPPENIDDGVPDPTNLFVVPDRFPNDVPLTGYGYEGAANSGGTDIMAIYEITRTDESESAIVTTELTYTPLKRISSVKKGGWGITYSWGMPSVKPPDTTNQTGIDPQAKFLYDRLLWMEEKVDTTVAVTCFSYDGYGRLVTQTTPDGAHTHYLYASSDDTEPRDYLQRVQQVAHYQNTPCDANRAVPTVNEANRLTTETYDYIVCNSDTDRPECPSYDVLYSQITEEAAGVLSPSPRNALRLNLIYYDWTGRVTRSAMQRRPRPAPDTVTPVLYDDQVITCYTYNAAVGTLAGYGTLYNFVNDACESLMSPSSAILENVQGEHYTLTYDGFDLRKIYNTLSPAQQWNFMHQIAALNLMFDAGDEAVVEVQYDVEQRPQAVIERLGSNVLRRILYRYNTIGYLTCVQLFEAENQQPAISRFYHYSPRGQLMEVTSDCDGTGQIIERFTYDSNGYVHQWVRTTAGGLPAHYTFEHDLNGRVTKVRRVSAGRTYEMFMGYDIAGRMTYSTDWNGYLTTYTTDYPPAPLSYNDKSPVENLRRREAVCYHTVRYKPEDDFPSICTGTLMTQFFDAFGNLIRREQDNRVSVFTYNEWDQLIAEDITTWPIDTDNGELRISWYYTYTPEGRLSTITDNNGLSYTLQYDRRGNLASVDEAGQPRRDFVYDANDNLAIASRGTSDVKVFFYDALNRLERFSPGCGRDSTSYTVNTLPSFRFITDTFAACPFKADVTIGYDVLDNVQRIELSTETETSATLEAVYDESYTWLQQTSLVLAGEINTTYAGWQYDYSQDADLLVVKATNIVSSDPASTLTYSVNDRGQPIKIEAASGQRLWAWYDGNGALCGYQIVVSEETALYTPTDSICAFPEDENSFINQAGSAVFYTYDYRGRLTGIRTGRETLSYVYNDFDTLASIIRSSTTQCLSTYYDYTYTLDRINLSVKQATSAVPCAPREEVSPLETSRLVYDAQGKLLEAWQNGRTHRFVYNQGGQLTRIIDPAANTVLWDYDINGDLIGLEDTAGRRWELTRSVEGLHLPSSVTMPDGQNVTLSYENGFLTCLGDVCPSSERPPESAILSRFSLDPTGRLLEDVSPLQTSSKGRTFNYNDMGLLASIQVGADTVQYQYNSAYIGQVQNIDGSLYQFDLNGRPDTITTADKWVYDYTWQYGLSLSGEVEARLQDITVTDPNGNTTQQSIGYDDLARRTSLCFFADGTLQYLIAYNYDSRGRHSTVRASLTAPACNPALLEKNDPIHITLEIGFTYDDLHNDKVKEIRRYKALSAAQSDLEHTYDLCSQYTYDAAGHVMGITHDVCDGDDGGDSPEITEIRQFNELPLSYSYELYDETGMPQRVHIIQADGTEYTIVYSYDDNRQLTEERWFTSQRNEPVYTLVIYQDDNITSKTVTQGDVLKTYCYDRGQRLYAITRGSDCRSIEPKDVSYCNANATFSLLPPLEMELVYDTSSRLCVRASVTNTNQPEVVFFNYTPTGLLQSGTKRSPAQNFQLSYTPQGSISQMVSDVEGIQKPSTFFYDGTNMLLSRSGNTADVPNVFYVRAPGMPLLFILEQSKDRLTLYSPLEDAAQSVRQLQSMTFDTTGNVRSASPIHLNYNQYGDELFAPVDEEGIRANGWYRFVGMSPEPASDIQGVNFYVLNGRVYSPSLRACWQPDSRGPNLLNQRYNCYGDFATDTIISLPAYPVPAVPTVEPVSPSLMGYQVPLPELLHPSNGLEMLAGIGRSTVNELVSENWSSFALDYPSLPTMLDIPLYSGQGVPCNALINTGGSYSPFGLDGQPREWFLDSDVPTTARNPICSGIAEPIFQFSNRSAEMELPVNQLLYNLGGWNNLSNLNHQLDILGTYQPGILNVFTHPLNETVAWPLGWIQPAKEVFTFRSLTEVMPPSIEDQIGLPGR